MNPTAKTARIGDRELTLTRLIDASPDKLYRCWTEPELLKQFFAPKPYETPVAEMDVRPGGSNHIVMRSPEGQDMPNRGVYLDVVPNRKLVFTDAFKEAWLPNDQAFMVVEILFEPEGVKTRYTANVRHWTAADCDAHEKMGFHEGWSQVADQFEALVLTL
jgi:uncharacterized protein YndB with AHSA1/START domain